MTLDILRRRIAAKLLDVEELLPDEYKFTLIARHTQAPDSDVSVSNDDEQLAAVALQRLSGVDLQAQLDAERGKSALIMEAFWLAIADLPHSDECPVATCEHQVECPHVAVDCTCKECDCACSCWRSAADRALEVNEAVQLCSELRDRTDALEAANARALRADGQFCAADAELNALKAKYSQALTELEDQRGEAERFKRLTEIMHEMYDGGSATVIDVLEEVKRRVALEATE